MPRHDAVQEAIEIADAQMNNFGMPTYSQLITLLRPSLYALERSAPISEAHRKAYDTALQSLRDGLGVSPTTLTTFPNRSALQRYTENASDCSELNALERLRYFCSLAMSGQDWLDVAPFFDAVQADGDPSADSSGTNTIVSDFAEFMYRVASQVPFEHAEWAQSKGAAILEQLKLLVARQSDPNAAHVAFSQSVPQHALADAIQAVERAKVLPVWDAIDDRLHKELDVIFRALSAAGSASAATLTH